MVERYLVPLVVLMMGVAGIYAFDTHYDASAPVTGLVVNSQQAIECSDSDLNDAGTTGVTTSVLFETGYAEDTCVGSDLLEYYCGPDGPDVRVVNCHNGCNNGACN